MEVLRQLINGETAPPGREVLDVRLIVRESRGTQAQTG